MFAKDMEFIIKIPPTEVTPDPDCHTGEFFQTFRKEIVPTLYKLFSQYKRGNTFQLVL